MEAALVWGARGSLRHLAPRPEHLAELHQGLGFRV